MRNRRSEVTPADVTTSRTKPPTSILNGTFSSTSPVPRYYFLNTPWSAFIHAHHDVVRAGARFASDFFRSRRFTAFSPSLSSRFILRICCSPLQQHYLTDSQELHSVEVGRLGNAERATAEIERERGSFQHLTAVFVLLFESVLFTAFSSATLRLRVFKP